MSSVIPAARVNFGMYPVFPGVVFRFYEKISPENRFSATLRSYFPRLSWVICFYFFCLFFALFIIKFVVYSLFYVCLSVAIRFTPFIFTLLRQVLEIVFFPVFLHAPFPNIWFMSFCTHSGAKFLQLSKLHKFSEFDHVTEFLKPRCLLHLSFLFFMPCFSIFRYF